MNPIVARLRNGEATLGGWIAFASNYIAEMMAHLDYDWVCVEAEHGAIHIESIESMLQAIHAGGKPSFVRVPGNDPIWIKRVLDAGAGGIIVPMVNSAEQARAVVSASRFPPTGRRSIGLGRWQFVMDRSKVPHINEEVAVVVMIEHIEAVANIDEILDVPGIDVFFVGPTDMGASLGYNKDEVEQAIDKVIDAGRQHGTCMGIHVRTPEEAQRRIQQGFQFIAVNEAGRFIQQASNEFLKTARS
jgi:2-keto-3-deoxy-L-rhamnonate aldolase RhmA